MAEKLTNQNVNGGEKNAPKKVLRVPTPMEMKAYLDQYVIGQEEAKKTLCVAVYNHYKRIALRDAGLMQDCEVAKSNVIMVGGTGSGKTLLAKTLARMLDVGFHIQDCSKITASGYVGSDVEDCIVGLLRNTNYDLRKTTRGIVVLDEIDKNAARSAGPSITRDVSGECVQQSLLKIVEGDLVGVPPMGGRKHPEQALIYVDTKDVLFIATGAFVGLEDIVASRVGAGKNRIGFASSNLGVSGDASRSILSMLTPQDLRDFGMIPEFVGRFPVLCNTEKLTKADLVKIISEPKDALIKQYVTLLSMDGVRLDYTQDALETIAEYAEKMGTGARGLRNIVETVMRDVMFSAPSMRKPRGGEKVVTLDAALVQQMIEGRLMSA